MGGCPHCGVGPEDECTMDCPSRDSDFDVLADLYEREPAKPIPGGKHFPTGHRIHVPRST